MNGLEKALANKQASGGNNNGQSLGAGIISTTVPGQGEGTAVLMETGQLLENVNPIVSFQINNTGVGNAQQTLRIGSVVSQADAYAFWGLTPGAADNAVIVDQYGAGCKAVQGFSELLKSKAVAVTSIKVMMSADDIQLNQNFSYKQLEYDGSLNQSTVNIAFSQLKTDYAQNQRQVFGMWVLDSQYYLEYTVLANKQFTLLLELGAANSVETFKSLPKYNG